LSLEEDLAGQLHDAVRAGDTVRRDTIRQLRATLHNEAISRGRELDSEAAFTVVRRLVNQHKDSINEFTKAGRIDLAAKEQAELEVLNGYLPEEIGHDEILAAVQSVIAATGASGRKDTGKVMRELSGQLRGRADMRAVNEVVQELLGE
jgi:hypothetical protein